MTRNQRRPRSVVLLLLSAGALSLAEASARAQYHAEISDRIQGRLRPFVDRKEIAGAVTLVGNDRGVLALDAIGRRSLEDGDPMRPDTIFRIASMTKPITAIGIMILADEG